MAHHLMLGNSLGTSGAACRHQPCASPLYHVRLHGLMHRQRVSHVCHANDYIATAADEAILKLPAKTELDPKDITHIYGYARNLHDKYFTGKVIGAGSFGVVRECIEASTGRRRAVKTIGKVPKRGPATPRYLLKLRTEVEIMQQLGYSLDAVNLKDVFEDNDSVHLVMELCDGGALLERIERKQYSEKYISRIVRSVLRFITQCHAKGIIYRDVKPDNFLFLTSEPDSPLKATDFGLSIRHRPDEPKLTSRSGTPAYMAPELVMQNYDEKSDLWSVGMMSYQLLTGRFPFWEDVRSISLPEVWKAILTKDIKWKAYELQQLSPSAVDFLRTLLQRDPAARPSAFEALEHPWIKEDGTAADLPLQGSVVQRLQRFSTYSLLKQVVLKLIMDDLTSDNKAPLKAMYGLKELFSQLDTDSSGSLSMDELTTGLRSQGYMLTDSEVEQLVRKVDSDADGNIKLSEFMTTMVDWSTIQKQSHQWLAYLDHAFKLLDINRDGFVSLDELVAKLPRTSSASGDSSWEQRQAEAKQILREADVNGDGKISKEEFYNILKESNAQDSLSYYDDRLGVGRGAGTKQVVNSA